MPATRRPLIVRLRNWIGDVVLALPALEHLSQQGHDLVLVGKPWARDLLSGTPWQVQAMPRPLRERVQQLRELAAQCRQADPGFDRRLNMVVFPFSFSSALDARLAGLKAIGYRYEARSWLLHRALPLPQGGHEIERYWRLACASTGQPAAVLPRQLRLPLTPAARADAQERLRAAGVASDYLVLCPFAGGPIAGQDRHWPQFALLAQQLRAQGHALVLCPGPNELESARRDFADTHILEGVPLSVYAAIIAGARLMVSNDTGPGHMAAAVGTPLVSVLGPTSPEQWRPWGEPIDIVRCWPAWPQAVDVLKLVNERLHG